MVSPSIGLPSPVLLLVGREDFTPPSTFAGRTCVATSDCIAVGVRTPADGPTWAAFAEQAPRRPADAPPLVVLAELTIESEGLLSLRDVYSREYEAIGVDAGEVRVTVLGDDASEPRDLTFVVGTG